MLSQSSRLLVPRAFLALLLLRENNNRLEDLSWQNSVRWLSWLVIHSLSSHPIKSLDGRQYKVSILISIWCLSLCVPLILILKESVCFVHSRITDCSALSLSSGCCWRSQLLANLLCPNFPTAFLSLLIESVMCLAQSPLQKLANDKHDGQINHPTVFFFFSSLLWRKFTFCSLFFDTLPAEFNFKSLDNGTHFFFKLILFFCLILTAILDTDLWVENE